MNPIPRTDVPESPSESDSTSPDSISSAKIRSELDGLTAFGNAIAPLFGGENAPYVAAANHEFAEAIAYVGNSANKGIFRRSGNLSAAIERAHV